MANPKTAQLAAKYFLIFIVGAFLFYWATMLYQHFGPVNLKLESVPFGSKENSVEKGKPPHLNKGLSSLSFSAKEDLDRAFELMYRGFYLQSQEVFEALLISYPDLILAEWGLLHNFWKQEQAHKVQLEDKIKPLIQSIKTKELNPSLNFYLESREAYSIGNLSFALDLARKSCEKAPSFLDFRLWYAKLLEEDKRYSQAKSEAKMAISLSQASSQKAYEQLSMIYHQSGDLDSAAAVLEYALSRFPGNTVLLLLQGYLYEYKGAFDLAEKTYLRILALRPNYEEAEQALATLGQKTSPSPENGVYMTPQDKAQVAYEILEPLVSTYPENLPLREALGLAYLKGRLFEKAKQQFQEIAHHDPEYPDIQLRIQESKNRPTYSKDDGELTETLNRVADSMRVSGPSKKHDYTTMLGHYLVRYGESKDTFFKSYDISNFTEISPNIWQESFYQAPYLHQYTVLFNKMKRYYGVHVLVVDSSTTPNYSGGSPDIYNRFLKHNSRISGIGSATGEAECGDTVIDAVVWETVDNFEILARIIGEPNKIRMIRFDKNEISDNMRLCDYLTYLTLY